MKRANRLLLSFMTLLLFYALIPIDGALALDGPIRNYKEVVQYREGNSTHRATCKQIPNSSTMKWENYDQDETKWPPYIDYDDGEYRGKLLRATQDLVEIIRKGGSCSSTSDAGNQLEDVHVYRAQYKGTVQTDPLPVKPPTIVYGSCDAPNSVPPRYEHELDVQLNRIDARTVNINSTTETDVYLKREDFSASRGAAKNEFSTYISQVSAAKSDCQSKIAQWQGQLSKMQSDLATCNEQKRPNCYVFSDAINLYNSQIAQGQAMLPVYDSHVSKAQQEQNYIHSNETTYQTITPTVLLRHDGVIVGTISLPLQEGRIERKTFPSWTVKLQEKKIMAQINETGPYQEFRYSNLANRTPVSLGYNTSLGHLLAPNTASNNWKDTKQYVATYATAVCTPNEYFQDQSITGVVRTVNDNGNRREILEEVTATFTKLPREQMRAGYGFEYDVTTVYKNHDTEPNPSNATGTEKSESNFSSMVNHLPFTRGGSSPQFALEGNTIPSGGVDEGYRTGMETSSPSIARNETKVWQLPQVAVEEFSGNVFLMSNDDHVFHPERNMSENLLTTDKYGNSLNKWYTPFTEPDGDYIFTVRTYDAGVNHLNTCHNGKVFIEGTIIGDPEGNDDYVKRAITPANPFPAGVGWNWENDVKSLTDLSDWYFNWYPDPNTMPLDQYQKTFYLTPETLEDIRKYHRANPGYKIGESVLDHVDIPSLKAGG